VLAARHYLMRFASPPPCRFDVVLVNGALGDKGADAAIEWLPAAFRRVIKRAALTRQARNSLGFMATRAPTAFLAAGIPGM
jgi:hypothetical protein